MTPITLTGLRKSFGATEVLKSVDLEIDAGEFTVILGPSGCGKSTLLRLVAGLEDVSGGSIRIGDRDVSGLEPRDRGCAMVFQNYSLYPHMSVAENIAYSLRVDGLPRKERRRRAEEIARLVQLEGLLDRKPAELSGGQRQRVAMARAIIRSPRVFLFDEPLSNLDAELRVQMRHEVRRIHDNVGATSIFVTHDQVEAMTLADRLVVMRGGEVQQVGPPAEVYERPQTLYVAKFIGSPSMGSLAGTYIANDQALNLSDGQRLDVGERLSGVADGTEVVAAIRPEALSLAGSGRGLRGCLRFSEELGSARLHHFEIADETVPLITADRQQLDTGAMVSVEAPVQNLHFFDSKTGARLRV